CRHSGDGARRYLLSFPTRRSSDLLAHTSMFTSVVNNGSSVTVIVLIVSQPVVDATVSVIVPGASKVCPSNVYGNSLAHTSMFTSDRKSTRLNSSHVKISYAVLCLK